MAGRLRLSAIAVPLRLPDAVSRRLGDAFCFVGPHGELDAVSRSELGHQAGDMELDCAHADVKLGADLGIRASLATASRTPSSRSVRASMGWTATASRELAEKLASSRVVTPGSMRASPCSATRTAWINCSGAAPLRRNPRAPALSAPCTYSSIWHRAGGQRSTQQTYSFLDGYGRDMVGHRVMKLPCQ